MNEEKFTLNDFGSLLKNRKTYYSIELYPPELYDENSIMKAISHRELLDPSNVEVRIDDDYEDTPVAATGITAPPNTKKIGKIVQYMKTDWLKPEEGDGNIRELPFNRLTTWETIDFDMYRLSEKFKNWIFIVYGKTELFVDNLWIKVYRNGPLIHSSNNIEFEIKIKLPNGNYKTVDKDGLPKLDQEYDISKLLNPQDRGFGDIMHNIANASAMFGSTIVDLGSLASEGAVAFKVLSIGLAFVNEMHQNMIRYGNNKGRCKDLYDRCNNIIGALQSINKETLNLSYVITVVQHVEKAKKILEEYGKQWKITRFISSKANKQKFSDINGSLNDGMIDFGVNYQIRQRIFKYKGYLIYSFIYPKMIDNVLEINHNKRMVTICKEFSVGEKIDI